MSEIKAGVTHDVILHVNDSVACGLMVMPGTYRVRNAPTFLPRFSTGDVRGMDSGRWKSWVQDDFSGGAGQPYHNKQTPTNRYAESMMMDPAIMAGLKGIRPASMPTTTTAESRHIQQLFTNDHAVFVVGMSNRPHMFHHKSAMLYTNLTNEVFVGGAEKEYDNRYDGQWAVIESNFGAPTVSVVKFSNVIVKACGSTINVYDGVVSVPAYNTAASHLKVYDNRLWRSVNGQVSHLDPTTYSADAVLRWSAYMDTGEPDVPVTNMEVIFGKMYIGKEDSLWCFDAGRTYEVENYEDRRDENNFKLLVAHRGYLYFNVRGELLRISGANLIEKIDHPDLGGVIIGGVSIDKELHITTRNIFNGEGEQWIFDQDTGGIRKWFDTNYVAIGWDNPARERGPSAITQAYGHMFLAPIVMQQGVNSQYGQRAPIVMLPRASNPDKLMRPGYRTRSYIILSATNLGVANIDKLLNRVLLDVYSPQLSSTMVVQYTLRPSGPRTQRAGYDHDASGTYSQNAGFYNGYVGSVAGPGQMQPYVNGGSIVAGFKGQPAFIRVDTIYDGDEGLEIGSTPFDTPQIWNGTAWADIEGIDGTEGLTQSGVISITDSNKQSWRKTVLDDLTENLYFIKFPYSGSTENHGIWEIQGLGAAYEQDWIQLGSRGVSGANQISMPFAKNTIAREIMLMVRFDISADPTVVAPLLQKVEVEFLDLTVPLDIISFATPAANDIETLQLGKVEHSGQFVAETLFSLSKSGLLYTVQLPWPPPIAHTITARVSIDDPGAVVQELIYNVEPKSESFSGAITPIRLDEMRTETRAGWGDVDAPTGF